MCHKTKVRMLMIWKKEMKQKVDNALKGVAKWEGRSFNNDITQIECCKLRNIDIVIGYSEYTDLYVAWNALLHKKLFTEEHFGISKKDYREFRNSTKNITGTYRKLTKSDNYEKAVIIKPDFLLEFCNNPFGYLMPNPKDEGYKKDTIFATPDSPEPKLISEFEK